MSTRGLILVSLILAIIISLNIDRLTEIRPADYQYLASESFNNLRKDIKKIMKDGKISNHEYCIIIKKSLKIKRAENDAKVNLDSIKQVLK
jgi:hypothetical protein